MKRRDRYRQVERKAPAFAAGLYGPNDRVAAVLGSAGLAQPSAQVQRARLVERLQTGYGNRHVGRVIGRMRQGEESSSQPASAPRTALLTVEEKAAELYGPGFVILVEIASPPRHSAVVDVGLKPTVEETTPIARAVEIARAQEKMVLPKRRRQPQTRNQLKGPWRTYGEQKGSTTFLLTNRQIIRFQRAMAKREVPTSPLTAYTL